MCSYNIWKLTSTLNCSQVNGADHCVKRCITALIYVLGRNDEIWNIPKIVITYTMLLYLYICIPLYSALAIYGGHFYMKNSRKTPHSSPVRARYGVSFVSAKHNRSFTNVIALLSTIVLYMTAIYRESIVPWKRNYVWDMGLLSLLGSIVSIAHR